MGSEDVLAGMRLGPSPRPRPRPLGDPLDPVWLGPAGRSRGLPGPRFIPGVPANCYY